MAQFTVNATRIDPYRNFKFQVIWDQRTVAGVSKVSALKRTTEVVDHREGNDISTPRHSPGRTSFEPLTLERGVSFDPEFSNWANLVYSTEGDAAVSLRNFRKDITINLLNLQGVVVRSYWVFRCWPSEYTALPELDANANAIAIQMLVLQNEGLGAGSRRDRAGRDLIRRRRAMLCVLLDPGIDGRRRAFLRPVTGADEVTADAGPIALLDRLLVAGTQAIQPGETVRLALADRDRLLAAIQRDIFGDLIEADAPCRGCGRLFAVAFSLAALIDGQRTERPAGVDCPDDGCYRLGEIRFRLPTSEDLDDLVDLPAVQRRAALLARCIVEGSGSGREGEIEAAMAALGPTLDTDVGTTCPHCAKQQSVRFAIERYLLRSIANERRFLLHETHRIARAYGWSHHEIMTLARRDRQEYVRLIDAERQGRSGRMAIA